MKKVVCFGVAMKGRRYKVRQLSRPRQIHATKCAMCRDGLRKAGYTHDVPDELVEHYELNIL